MNGELFTPAQKARIDADRPVVAGDLLLVAEFAATSISSVREQVQTLQDSVRELRQAAVDQHESFKALLEMVKLVAGQAGGLSESHVSQIEELTKSLFFKYEDGMLRTMASLKSHLRGLEAQGLMVFEGPWREEPYSKGATVQRDGHTWVAVDDTKKTEVPGKCSSWRRIAIGKEDLSK